MINWLPQRLHSLAFRASTKHPERLLLHSHFNCSQNNTGQRSCRFWGANNFETPLPFSTADLAPPTLWSAWFFSKNIWPGHWLHRPWILAWHPTSDWHCWPTMTPSSQMRTGRAYRTCSAGPEICFATGDLEARGIANAMLTIVS